MPQTLLSMLPIGKSAIIKQIEDNLSLKQRLSDLGFLPGTRILCLHQAMSGDPAAYYLRGNLIALRKEDAGHIICTPEEQP